MPLFDWPTGAEIWEDAAMRAEQIKAVSQDAAIAESAQKVEEAGPSVERRILAATSPQPWPFAENDLAVALPKYSPEQRQSRQDDQIAQAQKAVALMALHYLYDRAGQLNKAYQDKANEYKADVEMLLTGSIDGTGKEGLLGELKSLSEAITAGVPDNSDETVSLPFSVGSTRIDGYNTFQDEFSRSSAPFGSY